MWLREKFSSIRMLLCHHWTFLSNISQSDEHDCQCSFELALEGVGLEGLKLCKFHMTIGLLKNGLKRVCHPVVRGVGGKTFHVLLSLLVWYWVAHRLCVIPSPHRHWRCLSINLMGSVRGVLISHTALLYLGCSNSRRCHADNGTDDQREDRNSGLLGGYQANKWKTTEWSNQI